MRQECEEQTEDEAGEAGEGRHPGSRMEEEEERAGTGATAISKSCILWRGHQDRDWVKSRRPPVFVGTKRGVYHFELLKEIKTRTLS